MAKNNGAMFLGQNPQDRPDICPRDFCVNVENMLAFVVDGNFFGDVIAYIRVILIYNRGLPHDDCILIRSTKCKLALMQPELINTIIPNEPSSTQSQTIEHAVLKLEA